MQRDPSRSPKKEGEEERETSSWRHDERMTVVTRLHNLELANQRLAVEKTQLQRQLTHVLHRLASDRFCRDSSDLQEFGFMLRDLIRPQTSPSHPTDESRKEAPLASGESTNFLSSIMESNGKFSIIEYSSLSDTYEDFNLRQDPVRSMSLALTSPLPFDSNESIASETEAKTPVGCMLHSRISSEPEPLVPSEMMVSGTIIDTIASSSTQMYGITEMHSSSTASSEEPDWESAFFGLPPPVSSPISSSPSSIRSPVDRHRSTSLRHTKPSTIPTQMQKSRYLIPSSSLPNTPYKCVFRKDRTDAKTFSSKGISKQMDKVTSLDNYEQLAPPKVMISRKKIRHLKGRVLPHVSTSSSPEDQLRPLVKRTRPSGQTSTPLLLMRQAMKWVSHKPHLKVGQSEDFLNDFFSSGSKQETTSSNLHAAMLTGKTAELVSDLSRLSSHLSAYTCVRHHCFPVQTVPVSELQRNLDNYRLVGTRNAFENLCKEDNSSSDTKSVSISSPVKTFPQVLGSKLESPSKQSELLSSTSTEYHLPPTEDSNNNDTINQTPSTTPMERDSIHAGKLMKLSGRFKIWQTFWGVLENKSVLFYSDESEVNRWPRKCLNLTEVHNVEGDIKHRKLSQPGASTPSLMPRMRASNTFNIVMLTGKTYTMKAPNISDSLAWVAHLRRTLRRTQTEKIFKMYISQLVVSGWLHRYRKGQSHRVWCMLMGTYLVYARDPSGTNLTGYRDLSMTYLRCPFQDNPPSDPLLRPSVSIAQANVTEHGHTLVVQHDCDTTDSESDTGIELDDAQRRTLALWAPNRDPVYLVCSNESEYERWKYHLIRACWFSTFMIDAPENNPEGRFNQIWEQLVRTIYTTQRWHSDSPIREPMSRISDPMLEKAAIKLSEKLTKLSHLTSKRQDKAQEGQDKGNTYRLPVNAEKYSIIKEIAQLCFDNTGLKDELFLQLIKQATPPTVIFQTSTEVHFRTEPTRRRARMVELLCGHHRDSSQRVLSASRHSERRRLGSIPLLGYAQKWIPVITMWECISIYSTLFLPSPPVLACLQTYLLQFTSKNEGVMERSSSLRETSPRRSKSADFQEVLLEITKFAAFCSDMLIRCRIRGGRKMTPSCFEVVAVSLRNPYTHSLPFSLPIHVHLPSGYEVVSFDGTMKVSQLTLSLINKLGLAEAVSQKMCLCGLFCRISGLQYTFGGAATKPRLLYLEPPWNICDVISIYETTLTRTDQEANFSLEDITIDLVFLVQAVTKQGITNKSSSAKNLMDILAHQMHEDLCSGEVNIILRGSHFLELTALMCRCDHGDYAELQRRQETTLTHLVNRYFPHHCLVTWGHDDDQALIELKLLLLDRWTKVSRETSISEATNGLPRAVQAYTSFLWKLHPAAACVRHFPCQLINLPEIPVGETIWLAPSYDCVSFLRMHTFENMVTRSAPAGEGGGGMVSGMACFKQIPLSQIISFGVQQTGAFFLVYSQSARTRRKQQAPHKQHSAVDKRRPQKPQGKQEGERKTVDDKHLEKLLLFIHDLCQISEMCHVLSFYVENMT